MCLQKLFILSQNRLMYISVFYITMYCYYRSTSHPLILCKPFILHPHSVFPFPTNFLGTFPFIAFIVSPGVSYQSVVAVLCFNLEVKRAYRCMLEFFVAPCRLFGNKIHQ